MRSVTNIIVCSCSVINSTRAGTSRGNCVRQLILQARNISTQQRQQNFYPLSTLSPKVAQPSPLLQLSRLQFDYSRLIHNTAAMSIRDDRPSTKPNTTKTENTNATNTPAEEEKKLGLVARFKKMWRQYWYIVLPVHLVTSAAWFGSGYLIASSGVDVIAILEYCHFPESAVDLLRKAPAAGNVAIAYALYKIATPLRYMVTIGGTTMCIRMLSRAGYIKTTTELRETASAYVEESSERWRERRIKLGRFIQEKSRAGRRFHLRKNNGAGRKSSGPVNGQQKRSISVVANTDTIRLRRRTSSVTDLNSRRDSF